MVRHDGRNNVIGIFKPRRVGPDCDWSAARLLQSLAQFGVGFACFMIESRPFAIRSTRRLHHEELRAVRNAAQAIGDEAFVDQSSPRKLRLSERDDGCAWRQLPYSVRQGSERRKELKILVSRGVRVADQDQYFRQIAKPTLKRAEEFGINCGCVAHAVTTPSGRLQVISRFGRDEVDLDERKAARIGRAAIIASLARMSDLCPASLKERRRNRFRYPGHRSPACR
jgi:hypothetical protein